VARNPRRETEWVVVKQKKRHLTGARGNLPEGGKKLKEGGEGGLRLEINFPNPESQYETNQSQNHGQKSKIL